MASVQLGKTLHLPIGGSLGKAMAIKLEEIDQSQFNVSYREHETLGQVVLITPGFDKHSWEDDELHLRSLMLAPNGHILSSGFPKFVNYGEKPEHDRLAQEAIISGRAWHSEKMDGSLIIRSVINGQVHFRTRGSHKLADEFEGPVMDLIRTCYPLLLDPNVESVPNTSQLFEYTSPDNRIVLEYEEPRLTYLASMWWDQYDGVTISHWRQNNVEYVAANMGVPAVQYHELPYGPEVLLEEVRGWEASEGIVVRCEVPGRVQPHFVKIKAAEYVRLHSLKYHLTREKVIMFCYTQNLNSLDELKEEMYQLGVDWEAVSFIQPHFEEYLERKRRINAEVSEFIAEVDKQEVAKLPTRKRIALTLQKIADGNRGLFNIGIQYVLGNKDVVKVGADALILGISMKRLENYKVLAEETTASFMRKTSVGTKEDDDG